MVLLHKVTKVHLYKYALRVFIHAYIIYTYIPILYVYTWYATGRKKRGRGGWGWVGGRSCTHTYILTYILYIYTYMYVIHVFLFYGLHAYMLSCSKIGVMPRVWLTDLLFPFDGYILYTKVCLHIWYNIVQHMMSYVALKPLYFLLLTHLFNDSVCLKKHLPLFMY